MAAEWEYKGIQTDSIDPSYFTDPGANNIKVRGPDYLKDRKKVKSFCLRVADVVVHWQSYQPKQLTWPRQLWQPSLSASQC